MKYSLRLTLLLFSYFCLSSTISGQDFDILSYDVAVQINTDGSLEITERIDVNFTKKKRGIYRSIPTRYMKDGKQVKLGVSEISVLDHQYTTRKKNGTVNIRIGDKSVYVQGNQTYLITYKIENGIQDYQSYQELYIDLIGNEWKAKINQLTYKITLPRNISLKTSELKATLGSSQVHSEDLSIAQLSPTTVGGTSKRIITQKEAATIAIKLPKTYLAVAELARNGYRQKLMEEEEERVPQNTWLILFPLALFGFFATTWKTIFGKKYTPSAYDTYAYPPEGLTSAHVGAYIDQTANTRDIVSLIPYWAAEGFLEIENVADDTLIRKLINLPSNYPSYELVVFEQLFQDNNQTSMKSLEDKFYSTLAKAKSALTKEVHEQGYYKAEYMYWFKTWRLVIFPIAMLILGIFSFVVMRQIPLGIAFIALGIIGLCFGFVKLPLSDHGKKVKFKLDGLKKFLEDVPPSEIESILRTDPTYFEKMLPFAVAFGIEKDFIPKFEKTMEHMPPWYIDLEGSRSFTTFQKSFSTENIASAFSTSPGQSGGSQSGTGGFSPGGGIGGGGGGSW